jgi:hypothetical protein
MAIIQKIFAYNTGSLISGTTQVGDIAISEADVEYSANYGGLTWWGGPNEDLGYVIAYPVPAGDHPTPVFDEVTSFLGFLGTKNMANPFSESTFVELVNGSFNQSFTNGNDASTWLTDNGYWNSYGSNTPILYLDSANPASYPGSGTTWTDLIGGKVFNLINGVGYELAWDGVMYFNASNAQYAQCATSLPSLNTWSVAVWHYYTGENVGASPCIVTEVYPGSTTAINYALGSLNEDNPNLETGFYTAGWNNTPAGYTLTANTWYYIVGTYNGSQINLYVNNTLVRTTNTTTTSLSSNDGINLMRRWDNNEFWDGYLATVEIYDNALSQSQITTNWDNTKSRFIVTPTPTATPTGTPVAATPTPTSTSTSTPTPSVTNTQTPTTTNTPTPSVTPEPVTGYSFNLIVLPYNFPITGNTIMTGPSGSSSGTTNPNEMTSIGRAIYFNSIDSDGIDRTSYFSQFTGQSITITMSQTGSTAIYSGDTNAFKYWSANTGTPPGVAGDGFVFGTGISVPPITGFTGTTVLIQSATTNWTVGLPVYISAEINVGVTPTPTETSTNTPTPSVTNTQTPSVTPTLTQTPTPTSAATPSGFSVTIVESGGDVVMSASGSLNINGLTLVNPSAGPFGGGGLGVTSATFLMGTNGLNAAQYSGFTTTPSNFGPGGVGGAQTSASGNIFGVVKFDGPTGTASLLVPVGYTTGTAISSTQTFTGQTFSSFGLTSGTYSYTWGSGANADSINVVVGGAGVTPTPTATSVTPTPTPTSGASGWLFYYANNGPVVSPPTNNGNTAFIPAGGLGTYNPNYTGGTLAIYFNNNNNVGTSYSSQFTTLDTAGGTITISQGSSTAIYSGTSTDYQSSGTFINLNVTNPAQMIQSASTSFVSGSTINVVVS